MSAAAVSRLHDDKRGAVMVMGLFMSMLMIGALWCMIGIGDAMVFRQRMQEASDHAAFASAVVHAKGMNFIAMLNAVMLVLTIIYILMGIVHDILALLCVMTGFACVPFKAWQTAWHAYFNAMKPICKAIHVAEVVVADAAPWVGFGVGMQLGEDYGKHTIKKPRVMMLAMSSSMAPTRFLDPGKSIFGGGLAKFGLPVEAKPFSALCDKVGKLGGGGLLSMTGQSAGAASGVISGLISRGVKYRYCSGFDIAGFVQGNDTQTKSITGVFGNFMSFGRRLVSRFMSSGIGALLGMNDPSFDKFWNEDGPLYVYSNANNGSPFMQVWSVNLYPSYEETSTRRVGIAANMIGGNGALENTAPPVRTYFAQAEFYYDCNKDWKDDDCNGDPAMDANASYNMRWTTRLHAFEGNFGEMLGSAFSSLLTSGIQKGLSSVLQNKVGPPGVPRFIADKLGKAIGDEIAKDIGLGKDGALRKEIQNQLDFLNMPTQAYH